MPQPNPISRDRALVTLEDAAKCSPEAWMAQVRRWAEGFTQRETYGRICDLRREIGPVSFDVVTALRELRGE